MVVVVVVVVFVVVVVVLLLVRVAVVVVIIFVDTGSLPLKCCQNLVSNIWDIADIEFVWLVWWLNCGYVGFVTEIWV